MFRYGGWSQKPQFLIHLRENPLRKQNQSEFATEDERMPPQSPPLGVPRERCPFSVRVGGVSIRVSRTSVAEYLIDRAHLTPDSDASRPRILFSCLCKLLGKEIFIKHRSLVERSVLPTRSESTTFIPSVMRKKVIIVDQTPLQGRCTSRDPETVQRSSGTS